MEQQKGRETLGSKTARIFNSAVCFTLAYMIFTYLYWFTTAFVGKLYGFHSFVYYYGVQFMLFNHKWDKLKILAVYGSGTFILLVFALLCIYFYDKLKKFKIVFNVFLVWCYFVGTSLFAAQGVIASIGVNEYFYNDFYQNLAVVFAWLDVPHFMVYLLAILMALLYVFFATSYVRPFLRFAYTYVKVNKESRRKKYFVETVIIPFVIGVVATTIATYPQNLNIHYTYILTMCFGLLISWAALHYIEINRDEILKYTSLQSPSVISIFFLVCAIIFIYVAGVGMYLS